MKLIRYLSVGLLLLTGSLSQSSAQKAPAPMYRDPITDGAADPALVWNRAEKCWWMLYTQRRANTEAENVAYCYGTAIGIASSDDNGQTWVYRGTLDLQIDPGHNTFWAPDIVWENGKYHLFVAYIRSVRTNWGGHARIVHPGGGIFEGRHLPAVACNDQGDFAHLLRPGQCLTQQTGINRPAGSGHRHDDIAFFVHLFFFGFLSVRVIFDCRRRYVMSTHRILCQFPCLDKKPRRDFSKAETASFPTRIPSPMSSGYFAAPAMVRASRTSGPGPAKTATYGAGHSANSGTPCANREIPRSTLPAHIGSRCAGRSAARPTGCTRAK